ncbi:MAG: hypothetical protein KIT84_09125 [Labilithrix sp.]|nr:hypothetical protein [Labilithrix sp.]MCW5811162.1 hypothetical protein [Labilithrix sp.]
MVTMTLSDTDASFLYDEIARRARDIENELVHTDARAMQRDLAAELERLQSIQQSLGAAAHRTS